MIIPIMIIVIIIIIQIIITIIMIIMIMVIIIISMMVHILPPVANVVKQGLEDALGVRVGPVQAEP